MIRISKDGLSWIACDINLGDAAGNNYITPAIISEIEIKAIVKAPDGKTLISVSHGDSYTYVNEDYDNFVIEFFRPQPPIINTKQEEKKNKNRFLTY